MTNASGHMERRVRYISEPWEAQTQAMLDPAIPPLAVPPTFLPSAPAPPIPAPLCPASLLHPPPAHVKLAPVPPVAVKVARQIYRMPDGRCTYISPQGKPCSLEMKDTQEAKDWARHWLASHMQKELEDIEAGTLTMKQATILTTHAKRKAAERYRVYCPYRNRCMTRKKWFIRKDALQRHMKRCATAQGIDYDKKAWGKVRMALNADRRIASPHWTNIWEAAIWRIYHA